MFVPVFLVILQGDLGTAVTFFPIYAVLTCLAGIRRKHFVFMLIVVAVALPLCLVFAQGVSAGPDRKRIQSRKRSAAHGISDHTIRDRNRLGQVSWAKGFKQGSQGHLGFLPARHTDFVFAVLSEEKGFVGSITILGLFLLGLCETFSDGPRGER